MRFRRRVRGAIPFQPCLPRRPSSPPAGHVWVHEIKHDGFRILARRQGDRVRLFTATASIYDGSSISPMATASPGDNLRARSRSCRMARARASAGDDGRQTTSARHHQTWQQILAQDVYPRRSRSVADAEPRTLGLVNGCVVSSRELIRIRLSSPSLPSRARRHRRPRKPWTRQLWQRPIRTGAGCWNRMCSTQCNTMCNKSERKPHEPL